MDKLLDYEYLPSLRVENVGELIDDWRARAALSMRRDHKSDLHYGSHPREVLDFYPAEKARGCLTYIHGGYWVGFSKVETSWVVEGFLDKGISVALINYPLCPEVKINDIRQSCLKAIRFLLADVLKAIEKANLVVTGHSAGGHLAAAVMAAHVPIKGMIALSGVFDVAPLMQTSLQQDLRLDDIQAQGLNLLRPPSFMPNLPIVAAVGALESVEFKRQSREFSEFWDSAYLEIAKTNHFTIVDDLARPSGNLNQLAVDMIES